MTIRLSHIDYDVLKTDIRQLLPEWNGEVGPQGNGISIIKLPPEELEPAVYDENDVMITPPVLSDKIRYDISIHPNHIPELPVFSTEVSPTPPDHQIRKEL